MNKPWNKGLKNWLTPRHKQAIRRAAKLANAGRFGPAKGKSWKGGKVGDGHGYVFVRIYGDHPRKNKAGYVREHILVAEEMLGRYLLENEVVHHKNGVKNDNRKSNLQVLDRSVHAKTVRITRCPKCNHKFMPGEVTRKLNGL